MRQTPDIQDSLVAMLKDADPASHAKALSQLHDTMETLEKIVHPRPGILPVGGRAPDPLALLDVLEESIRTAQTTAKSRFPTLLRQSFSVNGAKRARFDAVLAEQLQVITLERIRLQREEAAAAAVAAQGNPAPPPPAINLQELIQKLWEVTSCEKVTLDQYRLVLHYETEPTDDEIDGGAIYIWRSTADDRIYYKVKSLDESSIIKKELTFAQVANAQNLQPGSGQAHPLYREVDSILQSRTGSLLNRGRSFNEEQQRILLTAARTALLPEFGEAFFLPTLSPTDLENPALLNLVALDNLRKACDALTLLCTDCAQIDTQLTPRAAPMAPPGAPLPAPDAYSELYSRNGLIHRAFEHFNGTVARERNQIETPLSHIHKLHAQIQTALELFKQQQAANFFQGNNREKARQLVTSLGATHTRLAAKIEELLHTLPERGAHAAERSKLLTLRAKWMATMEQIEESLEETQNSADAITENSHSKLAFKTSYLATIAPLDAFLKESITPLAEVEKSLATKRDALQKKYKSLQLLDALTAQDEERPNPLIAIQKMLRLANKDFTPPTDPAAPAVPQPAPIPLQLALSAFKPDATLKDQIERNIQIVHADPVALDDDDALENLPEDARGPKSRAQWRHLAIEKLKELHLRLDNVLKETELSLRPEERQLLKDQKNLIATELRAALQKQYQYYNRMLSVSGFVPPEFLDEFQEYKAEAAEGLKQLGVELDTQDSPPSLADIAQVTLPSNWVTMKDGKIELYKPGRDQNKVKTSEFVLDGLTRAELLAYFLSFVKKEMQEKGENMDTWYRAAANGALELKGYPSICFREDGSLKIRAKNRERLIQHITREMQQKDQTLYADPFGASNAAAAQPAAAPPPNGAGLPNPGGAGGLPSPGFRGRP